MSVVDLPRRTSRDQAERGVVGDAVAVTVGGDGASIASPGFGTAIVGRRITERLSPGLSGLACGVEERVSASLDQLSSLGQCLAHDRSDRTLHVWDEAGD